MRIVFSLLLLCNFFCISSQTFTLHVKVFDITKYSGHLHIAIFNDAESFPVKGMEYKKMKIPVVDSLIYLEFKLKRGNYAITMFHDANDDGICNKNKLGIPKEPYGFSNDIRPKKPKPSFSKACFTLCNDSSLSIRLHHPKRTSK